MAVGLFSKTVAVATIHCGEDDGQVLISPPQAEVPSQHMLAACFYAKMLYNLGADGQLLKNDIRTLVNTFWSSGLEGFYSLLPQLSETRPSSVFVGTLKRKGGGSLIISTDVPPGQAAPRLAPVATKLLIRKVGQNTAEMEDEDSVALFVALLDAQTRYYEKNGLPSGMHLYDGVQMAGKEAIHIYMEKSNE